MRRKGKNNTNSRPPRIEHAEWKETFIQPAYMGFGREIQAETQARRQKSWQFGTMEPMRGIVWPLLFYSVGGPPAAGFITH